MGTDAPRCRSCLDGWRELAHHTRNAEGVDGVFVAMAPCDCGRGSTRPGPPWHVVRDAWLRRPGTRGVHVGAPLPARHRYTAAQLARRSRLPEASYVLRPGGGLPLPATQGRDEHAAARNWLGRLEAERDDGGPVW